jgi:hypothetical protein
MRGAERDHQRTRRDFDPIVAGAQHGLSHEISLAIWQRVSTDATDAMGRLDAAEAQRRFHELAARIALRGGRLVPAVGRLTRVATELEDVALPANELAPRTPGRTTLVAVEARRWAVPSAGYAEQVVHAGDVQRALTALGLGVVSEHRTSRPDTVDPAATQSAIDLHRDAAIPAAVAAALRDGELSPNPVDLLRAHVSDLGDELAIASRGIGRAAAHWLSPPPRLPCPRHRPRKSRTRAPPRRTCPARSTPTRPPRWSATS